MTGLCPKCGSALHKPRSTEDHRRFFGLIKAAFDHWPEAHEFHPDSPEHLRAWLLCKAEYRDVTMIDLEFADADASLSKLAILAIEAAIKAAGAYAFVRPNSTGRAAAVFRPKSISFDALDQKKFAPLREAVEHVIEVETGLKAEDLLKEAA